MKLKWLCALVLVAAAGSSGCVSPRQVADAAGSTEALVATQVADLVLGAIAPQLARTSAVAEGAKTAAEAVLAQRAAEGESAEKPLSAEEWALIAGGILSAIFGLNTYRNSTRRKALSKKVTTKAAAGK